MSIGNPTEWLAKVSKTCRQITEQSIIALRDAQEDELPSSVTLTSAQTDLQTHYDTLREFLPDNFPRSRIGDLGRHIHFYQKGDCYDIISADIPDVLEEAEQYAVQNIPDNPSGEIGDYLHPHYRARLDREISSANPDYHALILKAAVILGDAFKSKAGAEDDKDSEIGRALKLEGPKLKVMDDLTSETNKNFQRGTMLLLQGARAYYRNTHSHGVKDTKHRHAVHPHP